MILGGRQSLQTGNVAWCNSMPVASGLWPEKKGAVSTKSSQNKGEVASGGLWAGIPLEPYKTRHEVASTWAVEPPCSRATPSCLVCKVADPTTCSPAVHSGPCLVSQLLSTHCGTHLLNKLWDELLVFQVV